MWVLARLLFFSVTLRLLLCYWRLCAARAGRSWKTRLQHRCTSPHSKRQNFKVLIKRPYQGLQVSNVAEACAQQGLYCRLDAAD
jgi:hypothetical protein